MPVASANAIAAMAKLVRGPSLYAGAALAVNDVTQNEGNAGATGFTFTVTRSGNTSTSSSVDYQTNDGSATAPSDYNAVPATSLSFDPGVTSHTVTVFVNGDTSVEPDETFTLDLSNPVNATISDSQGIGTITNDDTAPPPAPSLSINDVTLNEGNAGTTAFVFTVTRSGDTSGASSTDYRTNDGSAAEPSDYTAIATTNLAFAAGETTKTITVNVNGDTSVESDETFTVDLSNPVGATIADSQGLGTITNDDATPPTAWTFAWASTTHAPPDVNRRVAGSTVSVKFTLGDDRGLSVFADGWPKSKRYRCSTGELLPRGRTRTQPFGNAGLSYDPGTGIYTYSWQTVAGWATKCRQFQITLTDGSFQFAKFKFRAPPAAATSGAVELVRRRQ
jgi:hypothetical protein